MNVFPDRLVLAIGGYPGPFYHVEWDGLRVEQPTVSPHLAVLRRQGIVARRTGGNRAFYRIEDPTVGKLCEVVCGGLTERLATGLKELPSLQAWRGTGI